jgi:2-polyprenyl-6-methoxyphenol hydroxylase-like FAD-dependent oxidoreductase
LKNLSALSQHLGKGETVTEADTTTCAISGGGPAGMVLALLLARAGVEVTVFEKHGDFFRDFRGDTVHPVTLTLLDDLGLYQKFEALPHSEITKTEFTIDGRTVTVADFGRLHVPHPVLALVPQWDLLNLLADAGNAEPTFTLRMGTEVTGLLRNGENVAGVRYQSPDGTGELRADLTVACDGRTSLLRREAGLVPHEYPVPFDVAWFRIDTLTEIKYQLTPRMSPGLMMLLIPREGYFQAGAFLPKGGEADLHARGLDTFKSQVAALVPEGSVESITSWDDVRILDVRLNRLSKWHVPGLLCIGDAAHAMSPVGGVGVNVAIADAVATANILAAPLKAHHVTEADLARVQQRRYRPAVITQSAQRMMHRVMRRVLLGGKIPKPPKILSRGLVSVLSRFPGLSVIPAYLVGVGARPERAAEFAHRPPQ